MLAFAARNDGQVSATLKLTPDTMTTAPAQSHSPHLLSTFDLRGLALRNRVVMAPLTRGRAGRVTACRTI